MIRIFVEKLKKRIETERAGSVSNLSRTRHLSHERREALVEKNLTLLDVLIWIDELYSADEEDVSVDDDAELNKAVSQTPAPSGRRRSRRGPPAAPWGEK